MKFSGTNFWTILKSTLLMILILLESAPQTLCNATKMNKIRPILTKRQQFEKLVQRFLKRTIEYLRQNEKYR